MAEEKQSKIFLISGDAWFMIAEFITYHDIASISIVHKQFNSLINQPIIWKKMCLRYFDIGGINDNEYKLHFRNYIDSFSINIYQGHVNRWNEKNKLSQISHNSLNNNDQHKQQHREYSTGVWRFGRDWTDQITPKYMNLKDEVINNRYAPITEKTWNRILRKCNKILKVCYNKQ